MEVRGLPETGAGREPAVRVARQGRTGEQSGMGQARLGSEELSEDGDHGRQRGVAGTMGGLAANRQAHPAGLGCEGSGCHGVPGAGVGKDER